eukprot:NODE_1826_length_1593_cov_45.495918_g1739_i0.p1 GENE.NODE_1826_length_1593_cov_45.495918_g1739_i0~~NODE_1826_length_1593_cov_45.495918_g1739_i0.p1  ORF type:complete len:417 (-),score=55.71 NODE_1826_length_1593_cov_45.495918_g1739_i0:268-1518(-)
MQTALPKKGLSVTFSPIKKAANLSLIYPHKHVLEDASIIPKQITKSPKRPTPSRPRSLQVHVDPNVLTGIESLHALLPERPLHLLLTANRRQVEAAERLRSDPLRLLYFMSSVVNTPLPGLCYLCKAVDLPEHLPVEEFSPADEAAERRRRIEGQTMSLPAYKAPSIDHAIRQPTRYYLRDKLQPIAATATPAPQRKPFEVSKPAPKPKPRSIYAQQPARKGGPPTSKQQSSRTAPPRQSAIPRRGKPAPLNQSTVSKQESLSQHQFSSPYHGEADLPRTTTALSTVASEPSMIAPASVDDLRSVLRTPTPEPKRFDRSLDRLEKQGVRQRGKLNPLPQPSLANTIGVEYARPARGRVIPGPATVPISFPGIPNASLNDADRVEELLRKIPNSRKLLSKLNTLYRRWEDFEEVIRT